MPKIGIYVMNEVHFTIFIFNTAWAPKKLFSAGAEVTAKFLTLAHTLIKRFNYNERLSCRYA